MNYLIFDNEVYYDFEGKTGIAPKSNIQAVFKGSAIEASVAVIDTLQKQVAAPEKYPSRRDEVIVGSFTGEYLTQSEKIAENLFQIIAVEKQKINEVYKYLGFENVRLVVPYAIALREYLKKNNLIDQKKKIVFLDRLGDQVLLTIFNQEIFTSPRRLSTGVLKQLTQEVMRSQESYKSQNKTDVEISFTIITNSREAADAIVSDGVAAGENIILIQDPYPALSGLKQGKFSMHYMLPEEFIHLRKLKILRKRLFTLTAMCGILTAFLILFLGSLAVNKNAVEHIKELEREKASYDQALKEAYLIKYKDILRRKKKADLSYLVSSFLHALPIGCRVESINIRSNPSGVYRFEAIVIQEGDDGILSRITLPYSFKQARIENILVKGSPGLRVVLDIL